MEPNADQPKAPESKPVSKPESKDDLKFLPMPELQAKLGSSRNGLSQAEAQKRLTQYGPNEIEEKKTNPFLKFLTYFWGPIPWMIEAAVILSAIDRHWRTLESSSFCFWPTPLFWACAESLASENASRLPAMQRADKNIDELLEDPGGKFHRLRQSGIDEELFDVIFDFEALNAEEK